MVPFSVGHVQPSSMDTKLLVKVVAVGILYLILFITFVLFYMRDQLYNFYQERTTITSKIEQAQKLEFPTLIICMNPARKLSVAEKYGFRESADLFSQAVPNSTLIQRQVAISYILHRDYEILINRQGPLQEGLNNVSTQQFYPLLPKQTLRFTLHSIKTHFNGICSIIEPEFEVKSIPFVISLEVNLNKILDPKDVPQGYFLYLTSKMSWFGIIFDLWPQEPPAKINIGFKSGNIMLRTTLSQSSYLHGREGDTLKCLEANHAKSNCSVICDYLGNLPDVPACLKFSDLDCMFRSFSMGNYFLAKIPTLS